MGSRQAHDRLYTEELPMDSNQIQRCADSVSQSTGGQRLMSSNGVPGASEPRTLSERLVHEAALPSMFRVNCLE